LINKISRGTYKDVAAIILENNTLKVSVLPGIGSKIASIVYKPRNYEILWQNPGKKYKKSNYGDPYSEGECSGFDEMFPSITRCIYEDFPWAGVEIPDHGEVWSLPWDVKLGKGHAMLAVHGVRLPYKLNKRVCLEDNRLRIDYEAENLSDFDLDFIWAGHPLFKASKDMEFIVPPQMHKIVNAVPGQRLPDYGKVYDFPTAQRADGAELNLAVIPPQNGYGYQKYYFMGRVPEGWCVLRDTVRRLSIGLSFPKEKVPYLGMWLNEGGWHGQYNVAPEPATGAMDSVSAAKMWQMNSRLGARAHLKWHLAITLQESHGATAIGPISPVTVPAERTPSAR
jgi:galactose mutarotase-like enzyme